MPFISSSASGPLHDALPSYANPLHFPGIMLLDRPDLYCPQDYLQQWTMLLDQVFPAPQFVMSLPPGAECSLESSLLSKTLPRFQLDNFFAGPVDEYIDELCRICFPQGMKSMEKYFRWLSKFYAKEFGRLHMRLVDTIFRYNKRYNRGRYIASLAGIRNIL